MPKTEKIILNAKFYKLNIICEQQGKKVLQSVHN